MAAVFCNFCTGAAPVGGFPVASGLYCASHGEIMRAVLRQATRTRHAEDLYRILNRPRIAGLFMRRQKSRLERGEATLDDPLRADSDSEGPADGAWVYWTRLVRCSDESQTSRAQKRPGSRDTKAGHPEGVDPNYKEMALPDVDFEEVFQMTKAAFFKLPMSKQEEQRKAHKLSDFRTHALTDCAA